MRSDEQGILPEHTVLPARPDEAFDRIAGLVRRVIGVPVGLVSLVDREQQVFPGASGLAEPWATTRCTPLTHSFCQHVVRSSEALIIRDARVDQLLQANLAIPDLGVVAYAGIPLTTLDGSVVGSLCAIDGEPRDWTEDEIALLTDLAAMCSAELQLQESLRVSRTAELHTTALLELSETLADCSTPAEVLAAVDTLAREHLGAELGEVSILDPAGAVPALPRSSQAADPAASGEPEFVAGAAGRGASAHLPLVVTERVIGTIELVWSAPRSFEPDERALLAGLGRYTAQAVARAGLLADRRLVAETLQTAILPKLPMIEGVALAARYLPARISDAVGGDWFDAFPLSDGRLAVSVGDVEGHDTQAAAVMGQLSSTLRGLTLAVTGDSAAVLTAMDGVLAALPPARYATAILAFLERRAASTTVTWTNAGHPRPLVVPPASPAMFLDGRTTPPLGVRRIRATRVAGTADLAAGSSLLLFTDGLVEHRERSLDDTMAELRTVAERHRALEPTQMIDAILDELVTDGHEDDVAILIVRV